ncbi:toll-like receptor 6 [Lytechinus variegatus]|uniref:toll-like receptor 6 n=1 Tax=Lytechinus variegatus TaxID=7654 RepID=UPI001BB1E90E|nr:toll-like receptor 6 [Lytechinus variegatus]
MAKSTRIPRRVKIQEDRVCFLFTADGLGFFFFFTLILTGPNRHILSASANKTVETFEGCPKTCSCGKDYPIFFVDCSLQAIQSLSEITYPSGIYRLHLSNNLIREVPSGAFHSSRFLVYLTLSHNLIETLGEGCFDGTYNLRELSLSVNRLIDVRELHKISWVDTLLLSFNSIENFVPKEPDPFMLPKSRLKLDHNNLHALRHIPYSISDLSVSGNRLTVFDAHEMENAAILEILSISDNFLTYIPDLRNMSRLQSLDLSGNRIHSLRAKLPSTLATLNLNRMKRLSVLSIPFFSKSLSIRISSKSSILGLDQLEGVRYLHVEESSVSNKLSFLHMPRLVSLILNSCGLMGEFVISTTRMPVLQHLTLSNNHLTNIAVSSIVHRGNDVNETHQPLTKNIILDGNHLSNVSFINYLPELHLCNLESNDLRHISVNDFTNILNLRQISLQYNAIVSLQGFRSLPVLKSVFLKNNRIKTIHPETFSDCPQLRYLDLYGNELESFLIPFDLTASIEFLYLGNNSIAQLDVDSFSRAHKLQELFLGDNRLQNVKLLPIPTLRFLNLSGNLFNSIEKVNLESFSNLSELDLSENPIESAIKIETNLPPILKLRYCKLRTLSFLGNSSFEENPNAFNSIDITGNYISDLSPFEGTSKMYGLITLIAADNQIRKAPSMFFNLTYYDLAGNHVGPNLNESINWCEKLNFLSLKDNMILYISADYFISCKSLRTLDLSLNPLNEIGHSIIRNGEVGISFDFSDSQLTQKGFNRIIKDKKINTLTINNLPIFAQGANVTILIPELRTLDFGYNRLITLPTIACWRLINLIICHNELREISGSAFSSLGLLKKLDVSYNRLRQITSDMFSYTHHLNQIFLANNQISKISEGAFDALNHLESLILSNNGIIMLSFNNLPQSSMITHFDFSNNAFCCSCQSSAEFRLWLLASDVDPVICQSPTRFRGIDLTTILEKELCPLVESDKGTPVEEDDDGEEEASGFDLFDDLFIPDIFYPSEMDICWYGAVSQSPLEVTRAVGKRSTPTAPPTSTPRSL